MYISNDNWKNWMKDFKFGTLVFIPSGELRNKVDSLRTFYDPTSAKTSMAHITITQPFSKALTNNEIQKIQNLISNFASFEFTVGPATTSPNKKLIWLDISQKESILAIRENLHELGLFRTDLPLTKGFIPHMTISEAPRSPEEVNSINNVLNTQLKPTSLWFNSIVWILPDQKFVFHEHHTFQLKK